MAAFAGDLETAVWITSPRLAVQIGLSGTGTQQYDVGRGGTLAGIPVFTTEACVFDSNGGDLVLFYPMVSAIWTKGCDSPLDECQRRSDRSTDRREFGPTGATSLVSLFQTDCVGLLTVARVNWLAMVDDAIIVVGGCDYRT